MIGRGAIGNPWVFQDLARDSGGVSLECLYWTLAVFALFQEAQFRGATFVLSLMRKMRPWELRLGRSAEAWESLFFDLGGHLFSVITPPTALVCDERVLSRIKQITKLLQVGSCSWREMGLLQVKSVSEFFELFGRAVLEKRPSLE
jgi:tRNA-dihydrouridine synthase